MVPPRQERVEILKSQLAAKYNVSSDCRWDFWEILTGHRLHWTTNTSKFWEVSSLLNILYHMTIDLTFEKFLPAMTSTVPRSHENIIILKRQLAAKLTVSNDCISDFWETPNFWEILTGHRLNGTSEPRTNRRKAFAGRYSQKSWSVVNLVRNKFYYRSWLKSVTGPRTHRRHVFTGEFSEGIVCCKLGMTYNLLHTSTKGLHGATYT